MSVDMMRVALDYLNKGFSVIPIKPDKKPFIRWESYQKQKATPEEIREWWEKWPSANIAIVTGSISNIVVIDVDTEEGNEAIQEYIPETLIMPIAKTPRGGKHLFFQCPEIPLSNNARTIPGCDLRGQGGYIIVPPSQNGTGKAYEWYPHLSLDDVALPSLPEPYILFINSLAVKEYKENLVDSNKTQQSVTKRNIMFEYGTRDEDLFHVANCLVKGGMQENYIRQALEILALNSKPPFPQKEVEEKIKSALKRAERRERNLTQEVRDWISVTNGNIRVTNHNKEQQVVTREDKAKVRVIFTRLVKEGLIERVGNEDGYYRRIDKDFEVIDFVNASDEIFPIKWPFGIERYVEICPKNVIVVAGEKDAGKSAFLLNCARMNMDAHHIFYFSSEMGDREIKKRLSKFGIPLKQWTFTVIERSSNFSDVIQPDDVNIIDFLEIYDEFYKIGSFIKEIYTKLKKGIAIIAIQKNPKVDWGLGGMRSMEKARLYLSMEKGRVKIVSGKNWASQVRPDGLTLDFKLVQGAKFITEKDWCRT